MQRRILDRLVAERRPGDVDFEPGKDVQVALAGRADPELGGAFGHGWPAPAGPGGKPPRNPPSAGPGGKPPRNPPSAGPGGQPPGTPRVPPTLLTRVPPARP